MPIKSGVGRATLTQVTYSQVKWPDVRSGGKRDVFTSRLVCDTVLCL